MKYLLGILSLSMGFLVFSKDAIADDVDDYSMKIAMNATHKVWVQTVQDDVKTLQSQRDTCLKIAVSHVDDSACGAKFEAEANSLMKRTFDEYLRSNGRANSKTISAKKAAQIMWIKYMNSECNAVLDSMGMSTYAPDAKVSCLAGLEVMRINFLLNAPMGL